MIQKAITVSEKLSLLVKMAVKNLEIFDYNLSLISGPKNIFFLVKNVPFDPPLTQFISHFVTSHTIHNPIFSVTLFFLLISVMIHKYIAKEDPSYEPSI